MASVASNVLHEFSYEGRKISILRASLLLECSCSTQEWCDHRSRFVNDRIDSDKLREHVFAEGTVDLLVAIMPADKLLIPVTLDDLNGQSIAVMNANKHDEVYGVIGKNDGLMDIRNMYLDWLAGDATITDEGLIPCTHVMHESTPSRRAARDAAGSAAQRARYNVHVKLRGACATCTKSMASFDDLRPDVRPTPATRKKW